MNYFELHLGDYEAATAHLTALEDGIYGRLLRLYYRTEKPLPLDLKQVCRLARAQTKPERDAVEQVLADFFEKREDGYHQSRCDEEIARYKAGEPEREVKKANEDNRLKRHREERATLFRILTEAGQHAPWNIGIRDLRELVQRCGKPLPDTAPATPATATQTPDTNHQTPDTKDEGNTPLGPPEGGEAPPVKRKRSKAPEVTLAEWLAAEKAAGRKAIPADDAVFGYAQDIGLPAEFLHLAWRAFVAKYTAPPVKGTKQKTYVDWRAVFRLAVKEGWLKLWYLDGQQYALTTIGQQAQRELQAQPRQREEATA